MTTPGVRVRPVGHRPRGSGATTIRVVAPTAAASGRLFIGRALWQQIGSPARVNLIREARGVSIVPGDDYAVSGAMGSSIPRVSLGMATLEQLALDPGTYPGVVGKDGTIRVRTTPRT